MTIGIIGAMEGEVALLKGKMTEQEETSVSGLMFYKGKINGCPVILTRCGVGKVNAAVAAEVMCGIFHADRVINTGVAGALSEELRIGDIVLSTDLVHHDMDVAALGYAPGVIPDQEVSVFPADPEMLRITEEAAETAVPACKVLRGRIVSGDQFISGAEKKNDLAETFSGMCAEMEGAAIGHVCTMNRVPFLVIRAISDQADGDAHMDYPTFLQMAEKNSSMLVMEILRRMQ